MVVRFGNKWSLCRQQNNGLRQKKIQPGTGIKVGCADKGIMNQIGEGNLPFENVPEGTKEVNIFNDIHSPLLSGGKFVKEGKCTLVFGKKCTCGQGTNRRISKGNNETSGRC